MLSKCYKCNTSVTNDENGQNSYIVKSGTKKDITKARHKQAQERTHASTAHGQARGHHASWELAS